MEQNVGSVWRAGPWDKRWMREWMRGADSVTPAGTPDGPG